jgi:hypothetical protein
MSPPTPPAVDAEWQNRKGQRTQHRQVSTDKMASGGYSIIRCATAKLKEIQSFLVRSVRTHRKTKPLTVNAPGNFASSLNRVEGRLRPVVATHRRRHEMA